MFPVPHRQLLSAAAGPAGPSGHFGRDCLPDELARRRPAGRLRSLLAGTGISFGMYVGKTPDDTAPGTRMPPGSSRADYEAKLAAFRAEHRSDTIYPAEEVCTRDEMRRPGGQPRILLTNVKQLELLLTRQRDIELFAGARLDFLVFDEAHTFTGAQGAETACLIRRLCAVLWPRFPGHRLRRHLGHHCRQGQPQCGSGIRFPLLRRPRIHGDHSWRSL
ncbi:MAG UNVERIFIED_CONTAM: hypothetical protein LVR18_14960 [Planctomycetaceae bacterium]